ncbi:X-Pro dipeptidase [Niveispirillum lacus]|uniref:X-Pro dipeptidase n=1 Tax=Niveispirillum lacus TaxID=1981099 RepID=A0A255Z497_9PROT|nr:Xaa-Pro peptidase family protein [Niveispirillum lacus]OYQ36251.1 X-Pro dipeptidase [Niveispirillum lacus]
MSIGGSTAAAELAALTAIDHRAARPPAIPPADHQARIDQAMRLTAQMPAGALLIGAGASLRYFTGVAWGATERLVALLLRRGRRPALVCPAFELGSLKEAMAIDAEILLWEEDENPAELLASALAGFETLALDPSAPFGLYARLREAAPILKVADASPIIDGCRGRKSAAELALLSFAKAKTLDIHRRAAAILHPGIRASEVKRFIDQAHRTIGADNGSTFCAVQFGRATAFPHGLPGDQELAEGDIVLIDTGCQIEGYHSDITRTYVYGEPTAEHRRIWAIEKEAQQAAFDAARPGRTCESVDDAARLILERYGLGPDYKLPGLPHRTGHGIGLQIHEGPYLVRGDRTVLAPGMCFSNEPMIVIPDAFGVRLEDHMYITEDGAAWFTQPSPSIDKPFG